MVFNLLTYQRPCPGVPSAKSDSKPASSSNGTKTGDHDSPVCTRQISGIPDALSFDRIISGGTCPPMTCRDFVKYMIYVEHGAENLQFFLWHRDYTQRFENLPENEKVLSPEYNHPAVTSDGIARPKMLARGGNQTAARVIEKAFEASEKENRLTLPLPSPGVSTHSDPFRTPPMTPDYASTANMKLSHLHSLTDFDSMQAVSLGSIDHKAVTKEAFGNANVTLQPFTVQPLREEISRIISIYLTEGAPRELNLSERDRTAVVKALSVTTHPSAFRDVQKHIEENLRMQSHPNFIRWSIANGNRPRVIFARSLGVVTIVGGFVLAVLMTLSNPNRGLRAIAAPLWLIGIATLWAAMNGMCVVLHGLHHTHVRPWELWNDDEDFEKAQSSKLSFDSEDTNSYEDEPWVQSYQKRFLLRKVFDKEVWVQEPALRQIQDTIALQGLALGFFIAAVLTVIFVCIPGGNYF